MRGARWAISKSEKIRTENSILLNNPWPWSAQLLRHNKNNELRDIEADTLVWWLRSRKPTGERDKQIPTVRSNSIASPLYPIECKRKRCEITAWTGEISLAIVFWILFTFKGPISLQTSWLSAFWFMRRWHQLSIDFGLRFTRCSVTNDDACAIYWFFINKFMMTLIAC